MSEKCFFCDVQENGKDEIVLQNDTFFTHKSNFPVTKGHCEIAPKNHIKSFFDLTLQQIEDLFSLLKKTKKKLQDKYSPDGFNIGINEGEAAGQSVFHLHVHLIPRYEGDVENPRGGVRNVIPDKADYVSKLEKGSSE